MSKDNGKKITLPKEVVSKDIDAENALKALNRKNSNKAHETNISYSELFNIADSMQKTSSITNDIYDLFPDIKLTIELMVSSIMSPNDDIHTNINYDLSNVKLPVGTSMVLAHTIKDYIEEHYKLNNEMFDIIKDSMYLNGSFVKIILPTATILNLTNKYNITTGYESDMKAIPKDIIDSKQILGDEITISDDYDLLNVFDIKDSKVSNGIYSKLIGGYEDDTGELMMLETILDVDKRPIIKNIAHDKIIPIADVNDPSLHYGYFMILNDSGNSVNVGGDNSYDYNNIDTSMESSILTRAKSLVNGKGVKKPTLSNIEGLREYLITDSISKQLKDKNILQNVSDDTFTQVGDILLSRFIAKQNSKILYIPKELVTYYAYEYNNNGTGRPMLEKISVLASMRAITLFVTLLAYVKSSISTTNVDVDIDEDDDDYEATMEKVMTEVMKNRQLNLPIGILKVDDLTDWLHKIGFSFNFAHPGLPDTKVTVSEDKNDIDPVNSDLLEKIDKQIIQALGATPEMVDNSNESDFATTIVNNNILFARRTIAYQSVYNKHNTDYIRKLLRIDTSLKNEVIESLRSNLSKIRKYLIKDINSKDKKVQIKEATDDALLEYIYSGIVNKLEVTLPKPNMIDNTKLKEQFSDFKGDLGDVIDSIFDADVLPDEILGDFADKIDSLKNLIKSILIKRWLTNNNYMPEVTKLFTIDEDGTPVMNILEEFSAYTESIEKTIIPFLKEANKLKVKLNDKIDKIDNPPEEEEPEETPDDDTMGDNDDTDTTDDVDTDDNIDDIDTDDDVDTGDDVDTDDDTDDTDEDPTDDVTEEEDDIKDV